MESIPSLKRIGKYIPIRLLGSGSCGEVFLARHSQTNQFFALKTSDNNLLLKESIILSKIQHPNIITFHESFISNHQMVLVTEYCDGGELYDYIHESKQIPERELKSIFLQILSAVEYLHSKHIYHSDIKPENVMFDSFGQIKLIDFNLAQETLDGTSTKSCGSPHYSAPEIINAECHDCSLTEVWSLGVLLYSMVERKLPFIGFTMEHLSLRILSGFYREPSCNALLKDLIGKMLKRNPNERIRLDEIKFHPYFGDCFVPFIAQPWMDTMSESPPEFLVNDASGVEVGVCGGLEATKKVRGDIVGVNNKLGEIGFQYGSVVAHPGFYDFEVRIEGVEVWIRIEPCKRDEYQINFSVKGFMNDGIEHFIQAIPEEVE